MRHKPAGVIQRQAVLSIEAHVGNARDPAQNHPLLGERMPPPQRARIRLQPRGELALKGGMIRGGRHFLRNLAVRSHLERRLGLGQCQELFEGQWPVRDRSRHVQCSDSNARAQMILVLPRQSLVEPTHTLVSVPSNNV